MALDEADLQRRAEVARRLKAARWIRGDVRPVVDGKGKTGFEVFALTPEDLAKRQGMAENQMTASKIGSIERMERHTPPMEIAVLANALDLPDGWFAAEPSELATSRGVDLLQQALADLGLVPDPTPAEDEPTDNEPDHPPGDVEDDAA